MNFLCEMIFFGDYMSANSASSLLRQSAYFGSLMAGVTPSGRSPNTPSTSTFEQANRGGIGGATGGSHPQRRL